MAGGAANLGARRRQLLALRDQLVVDDAAAEETRAPVALDQESVGRLSRIDVMQVQAMALAAQRHRQVERNRIDAALRRIGSGDDGWCVRCGEEIEARRLDHAPATAMCLACAKEG
ncbi:TraR/DksA family transcriptional regulator [Sphingomonas sp. NPDC079357]|uniref:TraR/DksA family transcriptional regulator n=1 Tax=Sphingomonas sp. NPDC079357 TaxID=3364518 RepID=UPI00384ED3EC